MKTKPRLPKLSAMTPGARSAFVAAFNGALPAPKFCGWQMGKSALGSWVLLLDDDIVVRAVFLRKRWRAELYRANGRDYMVSVTGQSAQAAVLLLQQQVLNDAINAGVMRGAFAMAGLP
jgi:hypothetical protein